MPREAPDPTAPAFSAESAQTDPVLVVRVQGDVDAASADTLTSALDAAIRDDARHLVIDATGVGFIDSTGISVLVDAQRRLNRTRRRLAIATGPGALQTALQVTGLLHAFEVHASAGEAVAALAGAPLLGR